MTSQLKGAVYWAPLLHFYQPPTQRHSVLRKVVQECYRPLLRVFLNHPNARATFNISGVLVQALYDHGYMDVLHGMRTLAERGQVEFTGTAMYHAILPLIPVAEQRRQIRENMAVSRRLLGRAYAPQGFFLPELCYGPEVLDAVQSTGHRWLLLSGVASVGQWPMNVVQQVQARRGRLAVLFRDDVLSNLISFRKTDAPDFLRRLRDLGNYHPGDVYVITAQDAETFGHHIKDWDTQFLAWVFRELTQLLNSLDTEAAAPPPESEKPIHVVAMSKLLEVFPPGEVVAPKPSSWSTSGDDLNAGNPYPLWRGLGNELHALQWEHVRLCLEVVRRAQSLARAREVKHQARQARATMDAALHSCQFWWASRRPMWSAEMVQRGLSLQQEALVGACAVIEASEAPPSEKRNLRSKLLLARGLRGQIEDLLVRA